MHNLKKILIFGTAHEQDGNPGRPVTSERKRMTKARFLMFNVLTENDSNFNFPCFPSQITSMPVSAKVFHIKKMSQLPKII